MTAGKTRKKRLRIQIVISANEAFSCIKEGRDMISQNRKFEQKNPDRSDDLVSAKGDSLPFQEAISRCICAQQSPQYRLEQILMQKNASYVIADPDGTRFRKYGKTLERAGYRIKCLNLIEPEKSNRYNPFAYIRSDSDITTLTRVLTGNTETDAQGGFFFFPYAESALFGGLISLVCEHKAQPDRNLRCVMELLCRQPAAEIDAVFAKADPESFSARQFFCFRQNVIPQTEQDVVESCIMRLRALNGDGIIRLTSDDDIGLDSVGDEKTALFIIFRPGDTAYRFLTAALYTQLFRCLQEYAKDGAYKSRLIIDASGNVVKTFRPNGPADVQAEAEAYLVRAKNGHISYDDDSGLWTVRSSDGEPVLWRGKKEDAENAYRALKNGKILSAGEYKQEKRLPVTTKIFIGRFADTGVLIDFPNEHSVCGRNDIFVYVIPEEETYRVKPECCDVTRMYEPAKECDRRAHTLSGIGGRLKDFFDKIRMFLP